MLEWLPDFDAIVCFSFYRIILSSSCYSLCYITHLILIFVQIRRGIICQKTTRIR